MISSNCSEKSVANLRDDSFALFITSQIARWLTSPLFLEIGVHVEDGGTDGDWKSGIVVANAVFVLFSIYFCRKMWQLLFSPTDVLHDLGSIGYVHHDKRISKHQAVNTARRQRQLSDVPPVYPNGWFRLLDSDMLRKGQLKSVYALGEHLAIFRNDHGVVRVLGAYCPHMGANMATGGRIVNSDCLQCPFHGWSFSGESGECTEIPYSNKIPKVASVRKWPVCEENGVIYIWYHCDMTAPTWSIPQLPRLCRLKYVGRTEHIVNCHIQEIPENAADFAHLGHLHKPVVGRDVEKTYGAVWNIMQHDIEASWESDPTTRHRATMHIRDATHIKLFGFRIPIKTFIFNIEQIGPGNVHIHMNTPYFRGVLIQTITPTEPLVQRLCHSFYVEPLVPMPLAKCFFYLEATQIERDIMVWNNKTHLTTPILLKEESSVAKHRRWYKQFYSENSPCLNSSGTALKHQLRKYDSDW